MHMVFDHEGYRKFKAFEFRIRVSGRHTAYNFRLRHFPFPVLSFFKTGFPVGSLCHLSSCWKAGRLKCGLIDPLSKSLFSPLISSMERRESSMIFSWDTRSFPFNIFSVISGLFRFRSSTARAVQFQNLLWGKWRIKFIAMLPYWSTRYISAPVRIQFQL